MQKQTAKYCTQPPPATIYATKPPRKSAFQNLDHHLTTTANHIDVCIDIIRADGRKNTALYDTVKILAASEVFPEAQRVAWLMQLEEANLTSAERILVEIMSGTYVERDAAFPEQAYLSTFRNHL